MPTKTTKVKEYPTVSDIETAKAVFVARAAYITARRNYSNRLRSVMEHLDMTDYVAPAANRFVIDTKGLIEAIGTQLIVDVYDGYTPSSDRGRVNDTIYTVTDQWVRTLTEANWTQPEMPSKLVDVEATNAIYGARNDLPPASTEVTEFWRTLVLGVLAWADRNGMCNEVEDMLVAIGFGDLLPPREVTATVEWNGIIVEGVALPASRQGVPRMDYAVQAVLDKIRAERDSLKVTVVPAAAAA